MKTSQSIPTSHANIDYMFVCGPVMSDALT